MGTRGFLMKKFLIAAFAVVVMSVSAFAQTSDPVAANKELNELRTKLLSDARAAGTRIDLQSITEKVKARAIELTNGVDLDKVDAKDGYAWAQLFYSAGKYADTCELARKFLTTSPDSAARYQAQSLMMQSCNSLGEADQLQSTLKEVRVPSPTMSMSLASMTVNQYVDTIVGKLGVDAGLSTLEEVEKNLVYEAPADYAKRMLEAQKARTANGGAVAITNPNSKAKTDEERLKELETQGAQTQVATKFMFVEKKAELLDHAGQKDKAVAMLKEFIAGIPADSPSMRSANSALKHMTLVGAPAPGIAAERSYGTYAGLESLKGKVVLVDFFAHWCGPCIASFPDMKQLYSDLKAKGVEIVGYTTYYGYYKTENREKRDMDKDTEFGKMKEFIAEHGMPWPVVYGDRAAFEAYGVTGIPTVALIDRAGNVRKLKVGYSKDSFAEFRKLVEELLAEKK
jgi:thiol-disulfide isomerase/thioredoxin